jgi:hypothetical protein
VDRETLLQEIDRLREVMEKAAEQEADSLCSPKVIAISQQLDVLILDFYKIKIAGSRKSAGHGHSSRLGIERTSIS